MNKDEVPQEIKSPELRNLKSQAKIKNIYEKYSILKKSPAMNKKSLVTEEDWSYLFQRKEKFLRISDYFKGQT